MGSDFLPLRLSKRAQPFQSTLPRGERRACSLYVAHLQLVSIHAPAWGATCSLTLSILSMFCFNPRSRVGSDLMRKRKRPCSKRFNPRSRVGSDGYYRFGVIDKYRFNPRSRVGSDQSGKGCSYLPLCFNPRSRVGSDAILGRGEVSF